MPLNYTGSIVVRLSHGVSLPAEIGPDMHDLHALSRLAGYEPLAAVLERNDVPDTVRLITTLTPADSLALEAEARVRGKAPRRSITSYWRVDATRVPDPDELVRRLRELPQVDLAYRETTGSDPAIVSSNDPLAIDQQYLNAPPHGINARWMWKQPHGTGTSVRFVDLEQGWLFTHEDLPVLTRLSNVPIDVNPASVNHGTGVLGIVAAVDNDKGIVGIAPNLLSISVASHFSRATGKSGRVADAILPVIGHLKPGDVLLIEWQTEEFLPAEADPTVKDLIEDATALGIVVVEPAGNADIDLDQFPEFDPSDAEQDSRAIIVGACQADLDPVTQRPDRWRGSNHGARVDCFAAGEKVVTLGKKSPGPGLPSGTPATNDYRRDFAATSAAAAIIAGAAALLQGLHKGKHNGRPLPPEELRRVFRTFGTRQGTGRPGHIGVMPDLRRAAESLGLA